MEQVIRSVSEDSPLR